MAYVPKPRTIQLEGFAELEQQLLELGKSFKEDSVARGTLSKAAKVALKPVYEAAISRAPYDTSSTGPIHMRDTIKLDARIPNSRDKQSDYVKDTDAVIGVVSVKKSAVSLANEFGTKKMAAQPFLRPALESNVENVLSTLKTELGTLIVMFANKRRGRKVK